jgi:hypothetical protein
LCCALASCTAPDEKGQVTVSPIDSLYTVSVPKYLKPGFDMHDFAELQYYSTSHNFYLIGIQDAKQSLGNIKRRTIQLETYYNFVEATVLEKADSLVLEGMELFKLNDSLSVKVGDYYARSIYFDQTYELLYRIGVYETPEYFVQLVIWVPYESACTYYVDTEQVLRSVVMHGKSDTLAMNP